MLKSLLAFSEGTGDQTPQSSGTEWLLYVGLGAILVIMIVWTIISQRRQKKRQEETMSKLAIGSIVTTYSGVVGEVVEMDEKHIWIRTGTSEQKSTMQLVRQAIMSIAPAPGSPEAIAAEEKAAKESDEVDEIK